MGQYFLDKQYVIIYIRYTYAACCFVCTFDAEGRHIGSRERTGTANLVQLYHSILNIVPLHHMP